MRSVILIVVMLVSLVATNQLWFSRSSGWSDGKAEDTGHVPYQHPQKAIVWEKWGLLGYVEWRGTSAPPGPPPGPYNRIELGSMVVARSTLTVTCVLTSLLWLVTGWQLHLWWIETPAAVRFLRTWRFRLAFCGALAIPGLFLASILSFPPGNGPGFSGAFTGAAIGFVLQMSYIIVPVFAAIGYCIGSKIDSRLKAAGSTSRTKQAGRTDPENHV